jgi:hypothetical protein
VSLVDHYESVLKALQRRELLSHVFLEIASVVISNKVEVIKHPFKLKCLISLLKVQAESTLVQQSDVFVYFRDCIGLQAFVHYKHNHAICILALSFR